VELKFAGEVMAAMPRKRRKRPVVHASYRALRFASDRSFSIGTDACAGGGGFREGPPPPFSIEGIT
jgi:hypothetical protein